MAKKDAPEPTEVEHSYLDIGPNGPRAWVLAVGALMVGLAILAVLYGLYTINRPPSPTLSPDPLLLTQAASTGTLAPGESTPTPSPALVAVTPTPTATVTATAEPPTFTVSQGDSLIVIAQRLNVNVNDLLALNQISGETIFPGQVLLVPPTVTPWPATGPFPHIVGQGETLTSIAALYSVKVEEVKTLNGLTSDTIFVGQQILIPAGGVRPPTPTAVPPTPEPWQPAIITGELDVAYALTAIKGHFTLHIPPNTRAAAASETAKIARLVEEALDHSQAVLQRRLPGRFEVYVADTLFDAPYTPRRGFSLPDEAQLWLLYDGSGSPAERLYFATYALTHLIATQMLDEAASPLLGEGLAVYAGGRALASASDRYLAPTQFCAAYQAAGRLPQVSRALTFEGHLGHLDQYFAAGCFVGYLIERESWAKFAQVYLNGDYSAVYGRTLNRLELDWIFSLRDAADDLPFDPDELVRIAAEVDDAYRRLWADFEGTPLQFAAYERLDRARLALLQGRLGAAQEHLEVFETLLDGQ
jgi:LysM repeat protein